MIGKHTKGLWDYFVGNADGRGLIRIEQLGTGHHIASLVRGTESEANAALIVAMREYTATVAGFTLYAPGSTDEWHDAVDTMNRLIVDARKMLGLPEEDSAPADQ